MTPSGASLGNTLARCILVGLAAGCSGAPGEPAGSSVVYDLVAGLPQASHRSETVFIDLGAADGRPSLGDGWSTDEVDRLGNSFVWAVGDASTMSFDRISAGDLTLTLRARALAYPGAPPQRVGVTLNGTAVGQVEVADAWDEVRLPLPAGALSTGPNTVTLRPAWHVSPSAVLGTADDRALAFRVDWLRVDPSGVGEARVRIDAGTTDGREHLVGGWSQDETDRDEVSFVWSAADASDLTVQLGDGGPVVLSFRARPLEWSGAPSQTVAVHVNGRRVDEVTLAAGWRRYALTLPQDAIRAGHNLVRFTYAWTRRPADVSDSPDQRALAVAWDWLSLDGYLPPRADGEDLVLPVGTAVSWHLVLPPATTLVFEPRADAAPVAVTVFDPGSGVEVRHVLAPGDGSLALTDAADPPRRVRVSLTPVAADGADAERRLTAPRLVSPNDAPSPPNVLVYVVDTLRADHLGTYGYSRDTSPRIDAFAADTVVFDRAQAQAPWTKPAVVTLITGLHPRAHGAQAPGDVLAPQARTVGEILSDAGYATGAVVTNAYASAAFGMDQGYDELVYLREIDGGKNHQPADSVNEQAFRWLDARDPRKPFFLYLHVSDPHAPYTPPEETRARFAGGVPKGTAGTHEWLDAMRTGRQAASAEAVGWTVDLYDAEIAYMDASFGRLIDGLQARGLYDDTMIVFTSDHGEEFREHGAWEHGHTLYQELLHIPLVVRNGGEGRRSEAPVGQIDVMPTVLTAAWVTVPHGLPGQDLLTAPPDRPMFASLGPPERAFSTVVDADRKLIRDGLRREVYDLAQDSAERHDLSETTDVETLDTLLDRHTEVTSSGWVAPDAVLDDDLRATLRALGYLD